MEQQALVGVDIGTTSTKAIAFGMNGDLLYQHAFEYPILYTDPGFAEQEPEVVFRACLGAMKAVIASLLQGGYTLAGVSFSSAMHSLIAMSEEGNTLTNCMIWADNRSKEQAERLKHSLTGHEIYLHTGTPLHPMSPLPKLCWLREQEPSVFAATAKYVGIKEYVLFRLFGEYKIDYSIASATGLFNIFSFDWYPEALEVAGIRADQLPEPVPPTYTFRKLKPAYATLLNIPPETPFVIGASDGCLANLGSDAVSVGEASVTVGTSGAIRVMANKPATDRKERIFSYVLTQERFVLGGAVNSGGIVLQWFRDNFYRKELAEASTLGKDPFKLIGQEAAAVPAGADGLLFLPYLFGERSPIWDASARGCFFGVHFSHTRAHFLRALMEGVVFNLYSVGTALEQTTGPISAIYASGGFSRSELWVQMLADVFNKQVHVTDTPEGSALGAAIMGMYALGMIENLEKARQMISIKKTFIPDPLKHEKYNQCFKLFESLYPALKESFGKLPGK